MYGECDGEPSNKSRRAETNETITAVSITKVIPQSEPTKAVNSLRQCVVLRIVQSL